MCALHRFDLLRIALFWNLLHFFTFLLLPRLVHETATPLGQNLLTFFAFEHFLIGHVLEQTAGDDGGGGGSSGDGGGTGEGGAAGAPGGDFGGGLGDGGGVGGGGGPGIGGGGLGEGHGEPQQSLATTPMPDAIVLGSRLVPKTGVRHCVVSLDGMALRQSMNTWLHEPLGSAAQHESCAWQHESTEPVGVVERSQTDSDVKLALHQPGPQ